MSSLYRYIIVIFADVLLFTTSCFSQEQESVIDSICMNHHNLSKRDIVNIHEELEKLLLPLENRQDIDSLEYVIRYQSKLYLDKIIVNDRQKQSPSDNITLGDYYIDSVITTRSPIFFFQTNDEIKIDSIKYVLALNCYVNALNNKSKNKEDIISVSQKIANIYSRQGEYDKAKSLYRYTLDFKDCSDSLKYISLDGIVDCIHQHHNDGVYSVDSYQANEILPFLHEQIVLAERLNNINSYELFLQYKKISFVLSKVGDLSGAYIYSLKAIELAQKDEFTSAWGNILSLLDFQSSPYRHIGDFLFCKGEYELALKYYMEGALIEPTNIVCVSPFDVFNIGSWYRDSDCLKTFAAYPAFVEKVAYCYYKLGNMIDCNNYLVESYLFSLYQILYSHPDLAGPWNVYDRLNDYELILRMLCNHSEDIWGLNVSLLLKGYTLNYENLFKLAINYTGGILMDIHLDYDKYIEQLDLVVNMYLDQYATTYSNLVEFISKKHGIAIEYIYAPSFEDGMYVYYAILISSQNLIPIKIKLCTVKELEEYYIKGDKAYNAENSINLYNLIWSKLEPYINEGDDVYFAPDGLLYQMNIEVLQDVDGRRANEKWNLHRVSSTRELCMEKSPIEISSAALYGGLIYDVAENDMLAQSRAYGKEQGELATRGFVADSAMRAGWKYLDGSRSEVEAIADMCQSQNIETKVYTSIAGNEESFKALSGRKIPIIHLATHGFFYKNEEVENKPFFETMNFMEQPLRPDNSLKRSGLILAGGQKAWLGEAIPDSVEDGILLAEEIAAMDLTGTDLVVLSACETGLGEITSEGVFGLQRAFKKAGVQTLIMSLWKVDDTATSLFMQTFYEYWLGGKTKHEAFTIAQGRVRSEYSNPYYWAGFIMLD